MMADAAATGTTQNLFGLAHKQRQLCLAQTFDHGNSLCDCGLGGWRSLDAVPVADGDSCHAEGTSP